MLDYLYSWNSLSVWKYSLIKLYKSVAAVTVNWSGRRAKLIIQSHQLWCLGNTLPPRCCIRMTRLEGSWTLRLTPSFPGRSTGEGSNVGESVCLPEEGGMEGEEKTGLIPSFSLRVSWIAASRFQTCEERTWRHLSWSSIPVTSCMYVHVRRGSLSSHPYNLLTLYAY